MVYKKVFLYSAVVLSMAGLGVGAGKTIANAAETKSSISYTAPEKMSYTLSGGEIKGYMRVKRSDGSLEYMVTHEFVDKNGNEAYCMDSEKPAPNGHNLALQGKLGDEFYRMYEAGYAKKGNLNNLPVANAQEARYATQVVSWILSHNYNKEDIVWSTPERSQEEIDRVHKAFDIIWDHVQNGKTSTDTTYDLKKVNQSEDDVYYNYKFKSEASKSDGKASVAFDKEIPGMRILNKDGKEISKDNLPLNQEITIQIPKGTPTGELKITSEGDVKTVHVFKYGGDSAVQPANSLISVDDEHKTDEQKINWKLKDIVISTTATDKGDNDKVLAPDTTATVVDDVSYENLIVGKEYSVTGKLMDKETGKSLLVDGKEVTASAKFTAKTPNGKVPVEFTFNTAGLDSKKLVAFESMSSDNKEVATHADLNDDGQTVEVDKKTPKIGTTATDKADKDKKLATDQKVTVVDEVSYTGLVVGKEYSVTGKLMDKETGKPLLFSGKEVTNTVKFTAKTPNGKVPVEFTFNTAGLDEKELVVFENLKNADKDVAVHADLNDKGQTVEVDKKTPKIGTTATDKADKDKTLANDQKVTVVDEVSYTGLVVGKEYTVTGKLMDKTTGKSLLVDGKEVTGTAKFVAKTPDGKVNVEFTFNTASLENKELVAFESVKVGNKEVAAHADLKDKGQTVKVDKPETPLPQTGSENYQSKGMIGLVIAGLSVVLLSVYSIFKRKNVTK